jgi:DNA-directed RNA polymerase specialized sigma24 family protein
MVASEARRDGMQSGDQRSSTASLHNQLEARFRGPLMTFFLRRVRHHADAEDLTQETLMKVIATSRLERIENAESFVFTVATNLLRDRKRANLRKGAPSYVPIDEALAGELERELAENLSPERVLLSRDTLNEALKGLEQLGERTYNIFLLFRGIWTARQGFASSLDERAAQYLDAIQVVLRHFSIWSVTCLDGLVVHQQQSHGPCVAPELRADARAAGVIEGRVAPSVIAPYQQYRIPTFPADDRRSLHEV